MKNFLYTYQYEVLVFLLALLFRLLLIVAASHGSFIALGADGGDYVNEALNVTAGHGFSRATTTPYVPDAIRTPLYPLFLAGVYRIFHTFTPVVFIEALLSSIIPLIGMNIVRFFARARSIVLLAGLAMALEPHLAFYTTFFASEGISIILLYAGILQVLRWYHTKRAAPAGFAGLWLSLSALARPITVYMPILLAPLFLAAAITQKNLHTYVKSFAVFLFIFVAVLSPWLVRNYITFGDVGMGTVGWFNVYTRLAATVVAIDEKKDFYPVYHQLLDALATKGYIHHAPPVSEFEIQKPQMAPVLRSESIRILKEHPRALVIFTLTGVASVLTQDNTLDIIQTITGVTVTRPPFSPTLYISQHGLLAGVKALIPYVSGLYILPYIGRVFWTLLLLMSLVGAYLGRKKKGFEAALMLGLVAYFVLLTLNAGAQIDGRYRVQFFVCELALAAVVLEYMMHWLRGKKYE